MIKLDRAFHPLCLCPSEAKRLTDEFKATKSSVWNFERLKNALLETSHGKCAYCECNLTKESKYMEVEHFRDKDTYPDDVVNWANLLPSCKRCNGSKSTHDVVADPIVNPYNDDPRDHFKFRLYRILPKTPIGEESLEILDLNNSNRAVLVRFEIGEKIQDLLRQGCEIIDTYKQKSSTRTKNRLIGVIRGALIECQPYSEYAATAASVIHSDPVYLKIVTEMQKLGLWNSKLIDLDIKSKAVALDII